MQPRSALECPECGAIFFQQGEFDSHKVAFHPNAKAVEQPKAEQAQVPAMPKLPEQGMSMRDNPLFAGPQINFSFKSIKPSDFGCHICQKQFNSLEALVQHQTTFHPFAPPPQFQCQVCKKSFPSVGEVAQHALTHTEVNCPDCQMTFQNPDQLIKHQEQKHPVQIQVMPQCKECGAMFYTDQELEVHTKQLHAPKVKCTTCKAEFLTQEALVQHENIHKPQQRCYKCPQAFFNPEDLIAHMKQAHPHKEQVQFPCPTCQMVFTNQQDLMSHMPLHVQKRQCDLCGLQFTDQQLQQHFLTDCRPKCRRCKKQFNYREMQQHQANCRPQPILLQPGQVLCTCCAELANEVTEFRNFAIFGGKDAQDHLMEHMQLFHVFCKSCGECFPTFRMMLQHKQQAHTLSYQEQIDLQNQQNDPNELETVLQLLRQYKKK